MLRRRLESGFVPGAYVFPGGAVDEADRAPRWASRCTGLDDASASALVARLRQLRDAGAIVVVATHDLELAEQLLDHTLFLRDGRPAASMPRPDRLRAVYQDVMRQRPDEAQP